MPGPEKVERSYQPTILGALTTTDMPYKTTITGPDGGKYEGFGKTQEEADQSAGTKFQNNEPTNE